MSQGLGLDGKNAESEYLTAGQAAKALMVSARTLVRWADGGRIPYSVTLGGHRRFHQEDIAKILTAMAQPPITLPSPQDTD